jgi:AsmA-like C-terminal region
VEVEGKNIRRKFVVGDISQEAIVKCSVQSPYINLEDFKSLFGEKKQRAKAKKPAESFQAIAGKLDNTLANSVIGIEVKAASVKYQNLEAKNFDASIRFEPKYWKVARVSLNLAGGSMVVDGQVVHAAGVNHDAIVTTKINNVDVKKLLFAFDDFGQDAVTHKNLNGNFSATASLKAGISSLGKVMPSSLFGTLDFSLKNGALLNFPGLANIKTFVFKNRDMSNVQFAELKDKIDIKGSNIYINRMEVQSSVVRLFVEGNYCLKGKNTDLLIQAPFSNLNNESFTDDTAPKNKGTKAKVGSSVWLRAMNGDDGKIKIKLTLSKKLKDKKMEDKRAAKKA